jgi:hypothetical protein
VARASAAAAIAVVSLLRLILMLIPPVAGQGDIGLSTLMLSATLHTVTG